MTPFFSAYDLGPLGPPGGFDGNTSFEIGLYPILVTCPLQAFIQPLIVKHYYIWSLAVLMDVCNVLGALP